MRAYIVAVAVALLVCGFSAAYPQESASEITVTILYDNTVSTQGTTADWGFSCFIQGARDTILYDCGTYGTILLSNAETLGIDLSSAKKFFLSHDHYDHAGGLTSALAKAPGVPVYVGALFTPSVVQGVALNGGQPMLVTGPVEVSGGVHSTGELPSSIGTYEQSLVMDTDSGMVVVVGCSHPGIVDMLRRVKEGLGREIFAVFGGFHLLDLTQPQVEVIIQEFRNLGVRKCGATHCTGPGPIQWIAQAYGSDFLPMGVGRVLRFPTSTVPINSAVMWLAPGAIDFGDADVGGTQDTMTLTLENITPRPLTVSEISHTNPAFQLVNLPQLPAAVQFGVPLVVRAIFRPVASESYSDTIRLVSDDVMSPVRLIPVRGKGFVVTHASENTLYAASSSLYTLSTSVGTPTLVGALGSVQIHGLAVHPSARELYASSAQSGSTTLYRVDCASGMPFPARVFPVGNMRAIAFSRSGELYGATTTGKLYRLDLANGDTIGIGSNPGVVLNSLAFSPSGGLWAAGYVASTRDQIYTVNTTTGQATLIGRIGDNSVTLSIAFGPSGILYGLKGMGGQTNTIISVDTLTAAGTTLFSTGTSGLTAMAMVSTVVSVDEPSDAGVPMVFALLQNYPNPFNPATTVEFRIQSSEFITLRVYDMLGREVATLLNEMKEPGTYTLQFDGSNLAGGVYICRLQARQVQYKKLMLLK